jgi:hypothetical protein
MECLSCVVVFGALLSERSPHLKRQVNIVFLLLIIIIQGYLLHISSYCLLYLVFCNYILCILGCVSSLRVKEHYKWYQSSFLSQHASNFSKFFLG